MQQANHFVCGAIFPGRVASNGNPSPPQRTLLPNVVAVASCAEPGQTW